MSPEHFFEKKNSLFRKFTVGCGVLDALEISLGVRTSFIRQLQHVVTRVSTAYLFFFSKIVGSQDWNNSPCEVLSAYYYGQKKRITMNRFAKFACIK
jgi:hypothetical protein